MGRQVTVQSPWKEEKFPFWTRNDKRGWRPQFTTIFENTNESDSLELSLQWEKGDGLRGSPCLPRTEWVEWLLEDEENVTPSSEDSMEALAGSRTSSLEEVDSIMSIIFDEESEERMEQAVVASEADSSSSPWDSPEEGEATLDNFSSLEEDSWDFTL